MKNKLTVMNKAYKFEMYPNNIQEVLCYKTFGCCRKVWNLMLNEREETYKNEKKTVYPTPAKYKKEFEYLKEVDSLALANVQLNLQKAYTDFFKVKGKGKPKFKSKKKSKMSYTTNNQKGSISLDIENGIIKLPKLGLVKINIHRIPDEKYTLKSATISATIDGKFYCSLLYEYELDNNIVLDKTSAIGLDYKSDGLYVDSEGNTCGSPKYYRNSQEKLVKAQRVLSKKEYNSNNYNKQRKRVAKIHRHIANQREDFLHKKSTEIANQYDYVCVEDINLQNIANSGYKNGKATYDNGFGRFRNMLAYKLESRRKVFIVIDKFYASTQTCSCCGYKNKQTKNLSVHKWMCPQCKSVHDRDINAAINIRNHGLEQYFSR